MKLHPLSFLLVLMLGLFQPGFSQNADSYDYGKMFLEGDRLFVVMPNEGLRYFDISDPKNPIEKGFIQINGMLDLVVKGQFIFANEYDRLIAFKVDFDEGEIISTKTESIPGVFPNRRPQEAFSFVPPRCLDSYESYQIMRDLGSPPPPAVGSSTSVLTYRGDYLYAVNHAELYTFYIGLKEKKPLLYREDVKYMERGNVETIWADKDHLYLGADDGMYIYDITMRNEPTYFSVTTHNKSCDPVVVLGDFAFFTTRDGTRCNRGVNELTIVNITNRSEPVRLFPAIPLVNPHGLSIKRDRKTKKRLLIVCDGRAGLKTFKVITPEFPYVKEAGHTEAFMAYDVIQHPEKDIAIVASMGHWRIYDTSNPKALTEIARIPFEQKAK